MPCENNNNNNNNHNNKRKMEDTSFQEKVPVVLNDLIGFRKFAQKFMSFRAAT